jgi:acylphosphatase
MDEKTAHIPVKESKEGNKVIQSQIIVKGRVQKASFRSYVREIATENNLFGFVQNLRNYDRDVLIVCEGERKNIDSFMEKLRALKNDTPLKKGEDNKVRALSKSESLIIEVKEVLLKKEFEGESIYSDFIIIRDPDEAGERFDEGAQQIMKLRQETSSQFCALDGKYHTISNSLKTLPKDLAKVFSEELVKVLEEHDKRLIDAFKNKE